MSKYATTLNAIRSHSLGENGWEKLLKHLGKIEPDDEPLHLRTVLDSNGAADCIWCFRALPDFEAVRKPLVSVVNKAAWRGLPIFERKRPGDDRVRKCLETTDRWLAGNATLGEAQEAAREAWEAADAAVAAAWEAWAAADAAWAAVAAAWAAADAAWAAAWAAADAAKERKIQAADLMEIFNEEKDQ